MNNCQYCGKELNDAETKSNYCFECGKPAGIQSSKPAGITPMKEVPASKPSPKPASGDATGENAKVMAKGNIRCPKCNLQNPGNARLCSNCGTPLADSAADGKASTPEGTEKKNCQNCGKEVKATWKSCPKCGKSLAAEESKKADPEAMKKCPACGEEIEPDWVSCPFCGNSLAVAQKEAPKEADANRCTGCGKPMRNGWSVCPYCKTPTGMKVKEKATKVKLIFPDKSEMGMPDGELAIGREDFEESYRKGAITKDQLSYITRRTKTHFKILSKDGKYYIIDECSANGTAVNGAELPKKTEHELKDSSEIVLAGEKEIKILFKSE